MLKFNKLLSGSSGSLNLPTKQTLVFLRENLLKYTNHVGRQSIQAVDASVYISRSTLKSIFHINVYELVYFPAEIIRKTLKQKH